MGAFDDPYRSCWHASCDERVRKILDKDWMKRTSDGVVKTWTPLWDYYDVWTVDNHFLYPMKLKLMLRAAVRGIMKCDLPNCDDVLFVMCEYFMWHKR